MIAEREKLTMSVLEAADRLGIGKNLAYQMIAENKLPHIRLGGRILVSRPALERMLAEAGQPQAQTK